MSPTMSPPMSPVASRLLPDAFVRRAEDLLGGAAVLHAEGQYRRNAEVIGHRGMIVLGAQALVFVEDFGLQPDRAFLVAVAQVQRAGRTRTYSGPEITLLLEGGRTLVLAEMGAAAEDVWRWLDAQLATREASALAAERGRLLDVLRAHGGALVGAVARGAPEALTGPTPRIELAAPESPPEPVALTEAPLIPALPEPTGSSVEILPFEAVSDRWITPRVVIAALLLLFAALYFR
jgi:hypothetical protein